MPNGGPGTHRKPGTSRCAGFPPGSAKVPANRTVITVCRSGHRSAKAAALLARHGRDVLNLAGGMRAWARAGLPVVASGGTPGRVA